MKENGPEDFEFVTVGQLLAERDPYALPKASEPEIPPTFEELSRLEPAFKNLAAACQREHDRYSVGKRYCANEHWYWYFKPLLVELVGCGSRHPVDLVRTEAAYDVAYDYVYGLLPNCRNCGCFLT